MPKAAMNLLETNVMDRSWFYAKTDWDGGRAVDRMFTNYSDLLRFVKSVMPPKLFNPEQIFNKLYSLGQTGLYFSHETDSDGEAVVMFLVLTRMEVSYTKN